MAEGGISLDALRNMNTSGGLSLEDDGPTGGLNLRSLRPNYGEWKGPRPGTWEFDLERKAPLTYTALETAGIITPFMPFLFPSKREEFSKMGPGEKALTVGIDIASVIPFTRAYQGARSLISKVPFPALNAKPIPSLSVIEKLIPAGSKFEIVPLVEKVRTKWNLPKEEAEALIAGISPGQLWKPLKTRSGVMLPRNPAGRYKKLAKTKEGQKEFADQMEYWTKTPLSKQKRDFYREQWTKRIQELAGKKINLDEQFRHQVGILTKDEKLQKMLKLEDASVQMMGAIFLDTFQNLRKVSRPFDIGYGSYIPAATVVLPPRKITGFGEAMFGTKTLYNNLKGLFADNSKYMLQQNINYLHRMAEAGFGKLKGEGSTIKMKWNKSIMTKAFWREAGEVVRKLDDMTSVGASEQEIANFLNTKSQGIRDYVFKVHQPFHDDLYKDFFALKIPQIVLDKGLTPRGIYEFNKMFDGYKQKLAILLDSKYNPSGMDKSRIIANYLKQIRQSINPNWLTKRPQKKALEDLKEMHEALVMTKGKKIGFPNYLENYSMRIPVQRYQMIKERFDILGKTDHAAFLKNRLKHEGSENVEDLSRMIEARIASQAKELMVRPYVKDQLGEIAKLPRGYRTYFDYWLSRMLGEPSRLDVNLAEWLTTTVGGLSKMFGRSEMFTSQRVVDLAYRLNDMTYLGALGFKPYAAIRNLFQPLLTVPTDLGGTKDMAWLLMGYKSAMKKETQDYIKNTLHAIAEYTEEMAGTKLLPQFGLTIGGKQVTPHMQELRDVGMWLFKKSDQFNRYVSGGAAIEKWEHFAKKYLDPKNDKYNPNKFMRKMKFSGREDDIRRSLEKMFEDMPRNLNSLEDVKLATEGAKRMFVSDVIADTQWLYGKADSPLATSRWGIVSRTGFIFQSWWMNYLGSLEKWMFRGSPSQKLDRFCSWMLTSAVAGELMTHGAGFQEHQAWKTTFGGPIPNELNEFAIPPTWAPIWHFSSALVSVSKLDFDTAGRKGKALGRSVLIMAPGGLQAKKMFDMSTKDGWEGLARSITNYHGFNGERRQFLVPWDKLK